MNNKSLLNIHDLIKKKKREEEKGTWKEEQNSHIDERYNKNKSEKLYTTHGA